MNPDCRQELFDRDGDIIEIAHITPYCKTSDNSYENLVILCPSCHTKFDKLSLFTNEQVLEWKRIRQEELQRLFSRRFSSFEELKQIVVPLLLENKSIYENYYLTGNRQLWDKVENKVLVNNRKLSELFRINIDLFQRHSKSEYSNKAIVQKFLSHVDEFERTRLDGERIRQVLFPPEIDSIFGILPVKENILSSTKAMEMLISQLINQGLFCGICLGVDNPYITLNANGSPDHIYLTDTPRLRQFYRDYRCRLIPGVNLDSLNYALKFIRKNGIAFDFISPSNLCEITVSDVHIVFCYEYCLSVSNLMKMAPGEGTVIVNLHRWNGHRSISQEARSMGVSMGVKLLSMDEYYGYIKELKYKYQ